MTYRLLLVEDDPQLGPALLRGLISAGYAVELHTEGAGAVDRVLAGGFDGVILDLGLPGADGYSILDTLVSRCSIPVIVVTARISLDDRLATFERGAVDYLAKPFFVEELVARLRARVGRPAAARRVVRWRDVAVDLASRRVWIGALEVALTGHEFNILAYLIERDGEAVDRERLATDVLTADLSPRPRTVDSHVTRLRKKLGAEGAVIRTVWRIGYRFDRHAPRGVVEEFGEPLENAG